MFKSILTAAVLLFTASGFATQFNCAKTVGNQDQLIVISDAFFLVCQGPKGSDWSNKDIRLKYCIADSLLVTSSGKSVNQNGIEYTTGGSVMSIGNEFPSGLTILAKLTAKSAAATTVDGTLSINAPNTIGNSLILSKRLGITMSKQTTLTGCRML